MSNALRAPNGRFRRATLGDVLDRLIVGGPIDPKRWGRDHWSTLLYVDTRIVDHHGLLHAMPHDSVRGPKGSDPHMRITSEYPTRLLNPQADLRGHTDYDCLADAIAAGFLAVRERDSKLAYSYRSPHRNYDDLPEDPTGDDLMACGNAIQFYWTDEGYELISRLRRWRSEGQPADGFVA